MSGDIAPDQRERLYQLFKDLCHHDKTAHDVEAITDRLVLLVNQWHRREAINRLEHRRMKDALTHIDKALQKLGKFATEAPTKENEKPRKVFMPSISTPEAKHLLQCLLDARQSALEGTPIRKNQEVARLYYDWSGEGFTAYESSTVRKTTDEAALIWKLRSFWVSEFNEEPSKHRDHPFYEIAAVAMGKREAGTVWAIWDRNGGGNKKQDI